MNPCIISLGNGTRFEVDWLKRYVLTMWEDGRSCCATRDVNHDSIAEANDEGYFGAHAVWCSLVEHELCHTLVSRRVFNCESPTLRHEAGAQPALYVNRLHEEALVISFQTWRNTGRDPTCLLDARLLAQLDDDLSNALAQLHEHARTP